MTKFLAGPLALVLASIALTCAPGPARAQAGGGQTVVSGTTCPQSTVLNVGNNRPLIGTQTGYTCVQAPGAASSTPGTAPAQATVGGGIYRSTPDTLTNGQSDATQLDSTGEQYVNTEGRKATYTGALNFVSANGIQACFYGSASKIVRVLQIQVSGSNTTTLLAVYSLTKYSTVASGGTTSTITKVPLDSNSPASGASFVGYTAAPTGGTVVGNVGGTTYVVPTTTSPSFTTNPINWNFGTSPGGALVLRNANEGLCIIGAGLTNFNIAAVWTEE